MVCTSYRDKNCSAVRALNAISDQWSPLIIQDALFNGTTEFATFTAHLEISPDILSHAIG